MMTVHFTNVDLAGMILVALFVGWCLIGIGRSLESIRASNRVEEYQKEYQKAKDDLQPRIDELEKLAEDWKKMADRWKCAYERLEAER